MRSAPLFVIASVTLLAGTALAQSAPTSTKLQCEFRSEIKIKSLSISAPVPEIGFVTEKLTISFDTTEKASLVNADTGAVREAKHVSTDGTEHFIETPAPGQLSVLSVLRPDATGRKVAIWSLHAWGSSGSAGAQYGKPSQRFGTCVETNIASQ